MIRVFTYFCLLNILITESRTSTCDGNNCSSSTSEDENRNFAVHKVWLSQLFEEAKHSFIMDQSTNSMCKRDFDLYEMHLQNHSIWAIRMMESSEWPSVGIFSGIIYHMGNWRECVKISKHGINGKYCLAQVTYNFSLDPDQNITHIEEFPDDKSSVWVAIKMYRENPVRLDRQSIKWAICMPSSCRNTDLELALNKSVKPIFKKYGFNSTFYVNDALCSVKEESKMFQNLPLIKTVVMVWIIMLIGCTMYDIIEHFFSDYEKDKHENVTAEFLKSFSIVRSIQYLFTVSPNDQPPINLLKLGAMIFIVSGHMLIYIFGYPIYNGDYTEEGYARYSLGLSHSAVVDLFFALSGLHTFYHGFESTKKGGCFYLICSLIIRWLRMVPAFGILSLFIIYIFPFLSDGPIWNQRVMHEVNNCKETVWSNFLAINNFIKPEKQCLIVSWYISVDIQLSILGCILMYIITKNRKYGAIISFLMFLFGQAVTFAVVYTNNYYGLVRPFMSFLEDPRRSEEFNRIYIATFSRISPYVVGFATAFFAHYLKKQNYVFPKIKSRFILMGLLILSELSQIYGQKFFKFTYKYNRIENALYAALNRWMFVLVYCFLGLQYFTNNLDPYVNKIVNHKFYVPIGRLTYSVFLVNCLVQIYISASQADLMATSTTVNFPVWSLGILILTYIAGFVFHVIVEAPFVNLSKLLQHTLIRIFVTSKTETDKSMASSPQVEDLYEKGDNIAMDGYNKNPNQVIN